MYKGGREGSGEGCNNAYSDKEAHQRAGWDGSLAMNAMEMQNEINVCKNSDLRNGICCLSQQVPCGREDDMKFLLNQLMPRMEG